uniref:Ribonuclease P protein subunit p20 n=1 Tax=Cacopsylla melanoneura TaxID=428564 RepID=A0A8D8VBJ9_9HEMI
MSECSTRNVSKSNSSNKLKEKDSNNSSRSKIQKRDPVKHKNNSLTNVYVNTQSSLKSQIEKCEKLLKQEDEIIVHGLGSAVPIAINLALQLNTLHSNTLTLDVNTSTVKLVDDIEPTSEDGDYQTQVRNNSSVHIRIKHNVPITG